MANTDSRAVIRSVKEWITPGLVTIVGVMIWAQLIELKQDVKTLLLANSATQQRLAMLEKEVDYLRIKVYTDEYNESKQRLPERATPKKEEGPKVPDPEVDQPQYN